ncbi:hypothetical protein IWW34DRAFT_428355 [Fusarium oxysporum f. sp. albedinis]|nr:hypothetical protein IWW34DRAFT_428355 [Fusarium oxysporum f. sp. albedinis]
MCCFCSCCFLFVGFLFALFFFVFPFLFFLALLSPVTLSPPTGRGAITCRSSGHKCHVLGMSCLLTCVDTCLLRVALSPYQETSNVVATYQVTKS